MRAEEGNRWKEVRLSIEWKVKKKIIFSSNLTHCYNKWFYDLSLTSDTRPLPQPFQLERLDQLLYCLTSWNEIWEVLKSNIWENGNGGLWIVSKARNRFLLRQNFLICAKMGQTHQGALGRAERWCTGV